MCMFSGAVEIVSSTQIFARHVGEGRQALVYSMEVAARDDLAMVLPIPVPPAPAEDAVRFVNLHDYPRFFADMRASFDVPVAASRGGFGPMSGGPPPQTLEVHDVGSFEASFVPTLGDFDRLDPGFRMDESVWEALPRYKDWGFAVFKLKGRGSWVERLLGKAAPPPRIHPMAFVFPSREPERLFFPTVHVHDGEVHGYASFDHSLYCQLDDPSAAPTTQKHWGKSHGSLGAFVKIARTQGLVESEQPGYRLMLSGSLPNEDTWVG